jgi:hypothetical protein
MRQPTAQYQSVAAPVSGPEPPVQPSVWEPFGDRVPTIGASRGRASKWRVCHSARCDLRVRR